MVWCVVAVGTVVIWVLALFVAKCIKVMGE